jgi:hypothetical protein
MPKTVAMANANLDFSPDPSRASGVASVDGVIGILLVLLGEAAIRFRDILFVKNGIGDYIFFGSPRAKIGQPATIAAERETGVLLGIRRLLADRTFVFHGPRESFTTEAANAPKGSGKLAEDSEGGTSGDAGELLGRRGREVLRQAFGGTRQNFDYAANQVVGIGLGDFDANYVAGLRGD